MELYCYDSMELFCYVFRPLLFMFFIIIGFCILYSIATKGRISCLYLIRYAFSCLLKLVLLLFAFLCVGVVIVMLQMNLELYLR